MVGLLGLFAYSIGSLDLLNEALSNYRPENRRGFPRVTIKERKGQQTAIDTKNIHVASSSGVLMTSQCATTLKINIIQLRALIKK